jgi:hypothetical protein
MLGRLRTLLRALLTILLVGGVSGAVPAAADVLASDGARVDCCPDEDGGDADEAPCSPFCADCVCGFTTRIAPDRPVVLALVVPIESALPQEPLPTQVFAPSAGHVDELLRPPRV